METSSALLDICAVMVNSPHQGQWRGALVFSLICPWINGWVNNREAGDSRRNRAHYDVIVTVHEQSEDNWPRYIEWAHKFTLVCIGFSQTILIAYPSQNLTTAKIRNRVKCSSWDRLFESDLTLLDIVIIFPWLTNQPFVKWAPDIGKYKA